MQKKDYRKPELKSLKVDLGVFGDYGNHKGWGRGRGNGQLGLPLEIIDKLDLHME